MAAGTWSWPVKITSFSPPHPPVTLLLANALFLCRSKSLSQGWNWCLCVGGTATRKYTKAEINSQWRGAVGGGDIFDYLLVFGQRESLSCRGIYSAKFISEAIFVSCSKGVDFLGKKRKCLFYFQRFFLLFFLPRLLIEALSACIFSFPLLLGFATKANSALLFLYTLCIHENCSLWGACPFCLTSPFEQKPK